MIFINLLILTKNYRFIYDYIIIILFLILILNFLIRELIFLKYLKKSVI